MEKVLNEKNLSYLAMDINVSLYEIMHYSNKHKRELTFQDINETIDKCIKGVKGLNNLTPHFIIYENNPLMASLYLDEYCIIDNAIERSHRFEVARIYENRFVRKDDVDNIRFILAMINKIKRYVYNFSKISSRYEDIICLYDRIRKIFIKIQSRSYYYNWSYNGIKDTINYIFTKINDIYKDFSKLNKNGDSYPIPTFKFKEFGLYFHKGRDEKHFTFSMKCKFENGLCLHINNDNDYNL